MMPTTACDLTRGYEERKAGRLNGSNVSIVSRVVWGQLLRQLEGKRMSWLELNVFLPTMKKNLAGESED